MRCVEGVDHRAVAGLEGDVAAAGELVGWVDKANQPTVLGSP